MYTPFPRSPSFRWLRRKTGYFWRMWLPGSATTAFSLYLGEKGEIEAPFVFQLDIPQANEAS